MEKRKSIIDLTTSELRAIHGGCDGGVFYNLGCKFRKSWTALKDYIESTDFSRSNYYTNQYQH